MLAVHGETFFTLGVVMLVTTLLASLALMLTASLPAWPYSRRWGYYGAWGVGVLLLLVALLRLANVF